MRLPLLASLLTPPLCWGCGAPARQGEPLCAQCRSGLRWQRSRTLRVGGIETFAPVAYEGPAREVVRALKYRGARGLAVTMAAQMTANAPPGLLEDESPRDAPPGLHEDESPRLPGVTHVPAETPLPEATLVPVPLHPARRVRRGFNQAALLAAAVGARSGLPVSDCLERRSGAPAQVGRGRAARLAATDSGGGGVRLRAGSRPPPSRAVLVDDVVTTGATLGACAAVLRAGGCRRVVALAYARTPGR
jgi:predicted amidophosphoribosyltransferase